MTGPSGPNGLQQALAGEHAAVYVFGALAAQTSQSAHRRLWGALASGFTQHRHTRDVLVARIQEQGAEPVAAAPAYALPNAAASPALVTRGALRTERRTTQTWAAVVAVTTGADRSLAIDTLEASALRQLAFRGSPETFPGTSDMQ